MVLISKHDKKVWDKYILNFEKTVIHTKKNNTVNTENYKPSDTYSDTISRERKIIENLANLVAKQILNEISLVLSDGI